MGYKLVLINSANSWLSWKVINHCIFFVLKDVGHLLLPIELVVLCWKYECHTSYAIFNSCLPTLGIMHSYKITYELVYSAMYTWLTLNYVKWQLQCVNKSFNNHNFGEALKNNVSFLQKSSGFELFNLSKQYFSLTQIFLSKTYIHSFLWNIDTIRTRRHR